MKMIRQLHTIISRETIKPSFPTPPHLKVHNLSLLDQFPPNLHVPIIFFYANYNNGHTNILKQSLSQCLTSYYPFAGRFPTPSAPNYVVCNDEGVEFLEASIDRKLNDFILKKEQDETLNQLIPNGLGCAVRNKSPNLVEVQLNHFADGGVAVAVSISHKVADGFTMASFFNYWATVTRGGTPIYPNFVSSTSSNNMKMPELVFKQTEVKYAMRRFVFPNSKLIELKEKVNAMGTTPMNPTRFEVVVSLLFKCAVGAATRKSGSFKPSNLFQTINMRNKIINNCYEMAGGNIFTMIIAKMADSGEFKLNEVISKLRKEKMDLEGLKDVQEVGERLGKTLSSLGSDESRNYICSSLCRIPFYAVNFGWGNPVQVMIQPADLDETGLLLLDAPSGDGIEALVRLQEEEMAIFRKDKELLAYVEEI